MQAPKRPWPAARSLDAVILAGASARRLGGADKPLVEVAGRTLLDHVLAAVRDLAASIIVAGPERAGFSGIRWVEEEPPGGGPVAALAAALALVDTAAVLVLAADLPRVAPAIPLLVGGLGEADAAMLVAGGRPNYLAAVWRTRSLGDRLAAVGDPRGVAVRTLYRDVAVTEVLDPADWSSDCDTWDEIARLREETA